MSTETLLLPPVLLSVDLQQGLVEGSTHRSTPNLIPNVKKLLQFWRSKSWPIIHVQHDDIFDESNDISARYPETFKIHASAAPMKDEQVFVKNVGSAFMAAGLTYTLEKDGGREIVLIGMDGAQCINNTARHGADLGYTITVVRDACSSCGMEDLEGVLVDAETTHEMAMAMLLSYAKVNSTQATLDLLKAASGKYVK